jgi:hypothetical protein
VNGRAQGEVPVREVQEAFSREVPGGATGATRFGDGRARVFDAMSSVSGEVVGDVKARIWSLAGRRGVPRQPSSTSALERSRVERLRGVRTNM